MSEQSYAFATLQIRRAKQCLLESRTIYEGLVSAYKQGLLQIDIDRDLPEELADVVREVIDSLPMGIDTIRNDTRTSIRLTAAVRELDQTSAHVLCRKILALPEYAASGQRLALRPEIC